MAMKEREFHPAALAAASNNDLSALKAILAAKEPLGRDAQGRTLLCFCALFAQPETLALLLSAKTHAKDAAADGQTPLMRAALNPDAASVRALLPASDPKATDARGVSALMLAAMAGNPAAVEMLLPHSDARAEDHAGRTAFDYAAGAAYVQDDEQSGPCRAERECVELLAGHASIEQKELAISRLGEALLPLLCSALEADVLRREVRSSAHLGQKKARGTHAL